MCFNFRCIETVLGTVLWCNCGLHVCFKGSRPWVKNGTEPKCFKKLQLANSISATEKALTSKHRVYRWTESRARKRLLTFLYFWFPKYSSLQSQKKIISETWCLQITFVVFIYSLHTIHNKSLSTMWYSSLLFAVCSSEVYLETAGWSLVAVNKFVSRRGCCWFEL